MVAGALGRSIGWGAASVVTIAALTGAEVVRTTVGDLPRAWLRTGRAVAFGTAGRAILVLAVLLGLANVHAVRSTVAVLVVFAAVSGLLAAAAVSTVRGLAGPGGADREAARGVARSGAVAVGAFVARAVVDQADVLVVTASFPARTAATYAIATRLANAIAGVPAAVAITLLPMLGRASASSEELPLTRAAATVSCLAVVPVCMVLGILAPHILAVLFGAPFASGATMLRLMLVGQIVSAATGASATVLLDAGRHRVLLVASVVVSLATLAAELVTASIGTAEMVAAVSTAGFAVLNVVLATAVARATGVAPLPFLRPASVLAAARAILGSSG